ncbi:hypothetical protein G9A89_009294 [Geosiphon pyriformis]|nr:hypothetical protein G9A89_009294 [Geosiphon pyriformis]
MSKQKVFYVVFVTLVLNLTYLLNISVHSSPIDQNFGLPSDSRNSSLNFDAIGSSSPIPVQEQYSLEQTSPSFGNQASIIPDIGVDSSSLSTNDESFNLGAALSDPLTPVENVALSSSDSTAGDPLLNFGAGPQDTTLQAMNSLDVPNFDSTASLNLGSETQDTTLQALNPLGVNFDISNDLLANSDNDPTANEALKPITKNQANSFEQYAQFAQITNCKSKSVGKISARAVASETALLFGFAGDEDHLNEYLNSSGSTLTEYPGIPGAKVHAEFYKNYKLWEQGILSKAVKVISQRPEMSVFLIGYSVGGVYAQLAALGLSTALKTPNKLYVFTYGQPRVGNPVLAAAIEKSAKVIRFTFGHDTVPRLPVEYESQSYTHSGVEVYTSGVDATPNWCPIDKSSGGLSTESKECINKADTKVETDHFGPYFKVNFDNCDSIPNASPTEPPAGQSSGTIKVPLRESTPNSQP